MYCDETSLMVHRYELIQHQVAETLCQARKQPKTTQTPKIPNQTSNPLNDSTNQIASRSILQCAAIHTPCIDVVQGLCKSRQFSATIQSELC